ncbi:hypothetical protein JTB14_009783 [Gonioctena quinquepunctata]|nr:hypothetical protein JTB14_009783 [Gonioctena quinquepunctata]
MTSEQNARVISGSDALESTDSGEIGIGWSQCRVSGRKQEQKCVSCWEHGHTRAQCRGPDRVHHPHCQYFKGEGHQSAENAQ